jgi:hypothetical protein
VTYKYWDSGLVKHGDQAIVARRLVVVAIAPAVGVQAKEIGGRLVLVMRTLHVGPCVLQDLADICGGVANGNGAI